MLRIETQEVSDLLGRNANLGAGSLGRSVDELGATVTEIDLVLIDEGRVGW